MIMSGGEKAPGDSGRSFPQARLLAVTDFDTGCDDVGIMRTLMMKSYCVYIMTNKTGSVLYTGVSGSLAQRVEQHKAEVVDGFTKRYNVTSLVHYEAFDSPEGAIMREKQIKSGSRARKLALIREMNPDWRDLSADL